VISLSDLLTPWDVIEKRLRSAAEGDFAICLYNPASKKREDYLRRACDIVLRRRSGDTLCGWVKNIGRAGQEHRLLTLSELREEKLDMFTTVFIGASTTREIAGRMVTPRGYRLT
jgi:precorrin-3B C17-methyltransferase